jgi:signal peptidase I
MVGMGNPLTREAQSATELTVSESARSWREGIESVVVAIVLAFLFRSFEAEAFVIPTGSMAPTLQGRHKDVLCPECGYRYRAGASTESEERSGVVEAVTCPLCFYAQELDPLRAAHVSNTGDRILVNKLAYEAPFGKPDRWDVVVFKYPGNAKQNYIKRLVGLDDESLQIQHGDIFVRPGDRTEGEYTIARKPPTKLVHMLQLVNDTEYRSQSLDAVGWPANWQAAADSTWQTGDLGRTFSCVPSAEPSWIRFQQYYISFETWSDIAKAVKANQRIPENVGPRPVLITDFYAYNGQRRRVNAGPRGMEYSGAVPMGMHWVGDLALEAEVDVQGNTGTLLLDLVEAGRHHRCELDVATGKARLSILGGAKPLRFVNDRGETYDSVEADTPVRGQGSYRFRFANVDDQLLLWVNERPCGFDREATYEHDATERPMTTAADPGDLQPLGVGTLNLAASVRNLRVLRDIYYIATSNTMSSTVTDYGGYFRGVDRVVEHLSNPSLWKAGDLFDGRETAEFPQAKDRFFVLGDNSPQSQDGRLWGAEHYVERDLLIGEAVFIYWPHPLQVRIPFTKTIVPWFPNFREMGLIH